ncbi:ITPR1-like protein, partial [Mya arenaria]
FSFSSVHSQLYIYRNQDKDKPTKIPCASACVFQVAIQNRYKLNKKKRKFLAQASSNANLLDDTAQLQQHKLAAEAENADNLQEQRRQMGKRVRYGEIIQLRHVFTNKFVHMCTSQTSQIDKNNMVVMLQEFNAKNAQFRILPQYKVKSEGEVVQIYDQIVFESIKSPGHFLHASSGFQIDHFTHGSEINLGVERSGFTLVRFRKQGTPDQELFVRGGSIIRLFHKELEAYMVAEGLFEDEVTEDVHFRIRVMDQHKPRTLSPPTSGNSFWVIEAENSIFNGDILQWEQQVRLRHLTTRKYLCIDNSQEISLADDSEDPRTVFRLHSVINVSASGESQYDDAFTIQLVEDTHVNEFNYVAGMVPFLRNLIKDREIGVILNSKKTHQLLTALEELRKYMLLKPGVPSKDRQKLMRNLMVIDLLVRILKFPLDGVPDAQNIILVFKEAYEILYTYMIGKSRKNALYFAKYIEFFQTQFTQKGGIGLNVAQMIVELIRDKRKIVDRISHSQIDEFVVLLQSSQNYRFLDLLHVLCVCDDVAIPNNQSYIVERWMQCEQKGIYLTARGQDINKQPNILYLTTDEGRSWLALHEFVDETHPCHDKDKHDFLLHQLDLYIALCKGRNDFAINIITKELRYLTWEETFLALRSDILPDAIRAKYCDITTSLFVDIGNNYSVLAHPNICFVYDYVGSKDEEKSQGDFIVKELVAIFPVLRDWIAEFLSENKCMYATEIGHNMLIEQEEKKRIARYQQQDRYEKTPETAPIVNAKFQVLEVLDLLLTYQRNSRLQIAEQIVAAGRTQSVMMSLIFDDFDPHLQSKKAMGVQKKVTRELKEMFNMSAIFDIEFLTKVLMDLSMYKYDKMIIKSLNILNKLYSSKMNMFNISSKAQILLTQDSARVHREVLKNMPILRRLSKAKLDDQQVKLMGNILDDLAEFCHLPMTPDEPHPMNQNIMISNGILDVLFDILVQDIDTKLLKIYGGMTDIFKKAFYLLKLLARENHRVQHHIMERLDILLDVRVFCGNQATCLKISPRQIQKIVNRAADMQDRAPEFLDLLGMIVKVVGTNLTLKRNQAYVMKYIMQNYKKVAFVLDMTQEERAKILTDPAEISRLRYYISLLDLLAACAEGENMFIESLCQTILPIDDLLWVLNNDNVDNVYKKPFLKCLHHVYMKNGESAIETGASEMSHFGDLWEFMSNVSVEMNRLTDSIKEDPDKIAIYIKTAPEKSGIAAAPDFESSAYGSLLYCLEGVLPFLEVFYRDFYFPDNTSHPNEIDETDHLAKAVVMFGEVLGPLLFKPTHMKNLVNCVTVLVPISNMPNSNLEAVLDRFASGITAEDTSCAIRRGNIEYYSDEVEINAKFRTFTRNCSIVFAGHNTVSAQLKFNSKREYTILGGDEELPLGEEFQSLVKCFINPNEKKVVKKFEWTSKLIENLHISGSYKRLQEHARMEMDELNIKCLQVLRAIIHNEERRLPEDWATRTTELKIKKVLNFINQIQNYYDSRQSMMKILPHLATRNEEVAKEQSMLEYFLSTREEVFFMAVRDRMALSTNTIKEKRSLQAQMDAQKKKDSTKIILKRSANTFIVSMNALKQIQAYEDALRQQRLSGWKPKRNVQKTSKKKKKVTKKKAEKTAKTKKNKVSDKSADKVANGVTKDNEALMDNAGFEDTEMTEIKVEAPGNDKEETEEGFDEGGDGETEDGEVEYRNDGYIELVLKVMARMCDGQNHQLQAYLREQPDNLKTFNIILETTQFVTVLYSNITPENVDLTVQLFECINEFTADYLREQPDNVKSFNIIGEVTQFLNVIYSNITPKAIDLVMQLFESCIEFTAGNQDNRIVIYDNKIIDYINFIMRAGDFEDCPIDKEVKDTLDKKAVIALMTECFENHGIDKKKLEEMKYIQLEGVPPPSKNKAFHGAKDKIMKGFGKKEKNEFAEQYEDVGYRLYLILARMIDIDPKLMDTMKFTPLQQKAFNFYKKNCQSIEIVKDDELQKANFRVKSKRVLREEVKEMLKWNVDRSSPSNKIRDLMAWSNDIMKDIAYQRKILSNPLAIVLAKGWLIWNHMVTLLSFAINILMLWTWNAKMSLSSPGIYKNTTVIPDDIRDPIPEISNMNKNQYKMSIYILGGLHNFFCLLVFISYFAFLALSVGGTLFHGYFFAFHLLNIVNNNQLLSGVIKAVTQNGRSLVWVGILGLVVFYLYAIISFAMMRSMFNPNEYLYCDTLWQCTITVIRYGLIGDLFDNLKAHESEKDFHMFGFIVLYHVSFFIFITTIGLNIIFGIIVDTFSELRDLKWTAESDMRDTCFVCSRNSYDFEHHGKGFEHHVRNEHNMWAYIFFFIHLNGTKVNDYTALEMYVYKLLQKENFDFFPLDRALSLASMGQDSTEAKIDDLLYQVTSIVDKQKREELEKKRYEERMRQKAWEEKHRLNSFRRKTKIPQRSVSEDNLSVRNEDMDRMDSQQHDTIQLAIESPPQGRSPSYSRRPSITSNLGGVVSRRPSGANILGYPGATNRHDRYRRRRSVSPMDPRESIYRRSSPGRYEDDEPLIYDDRAQSPTLFGVDNDLLDITPVPISRRQSFDRLRSPRLSLATSPREHASFFSETDPMPYLRQMSQHYSQERRQSQTFSEGRPLTLPQDRYPDTDRGDADSVTSDDRTPETRF